MDIATLGYRIDSSQAANAARDLKLMTEAAAGVERSQESLTRGAARAAAGIGREGAAAASTAGALTRAATATSGLDGLNRRMAAEASSAGRALSTVGDAALGTQNRLDSLVDEVLRTSTALGGLSRATGGPLGGNRRQLRDFVDDVDQAGRSTKLTSNELMNFGYQFQDFGVQVASGSNPVVAFIQQASQMSGIFSQAAERGISFNEVLGQLGRSAGALLVGLLPLIAVVAAVAADFAIVSREMQKGIDSKSMLDGLNLTEKQLAKLKKEGVDTGVTLGDTFQGLFMTLGDYAQAGGNALLAAMGTSWEEVKTVTGQALDWIADQGGRNIAFLVGVFRMSFEMIKALWSNFPAVLGDIFVSGFNAAGKALTDFVNKHRDTINIMFKAASIVSNTPSMEIPEMEWTGLENQFRGKMADVAKAGAEGFRKGQSEAHAAMTKFLADWGDNTEKAYAERIKGLIDAAAKGKDGMKSLMSDGNRAIRALAEETAEVERLNAAREELNRQVMNGTLTYQQANDKAEINGKLVRWQVELEQVDTLRKAAKGDVLKRLTEQYDVLAKGIDAYRAAIEREQRIDATSQILRMSDALREQNRHLDFEGSLIGKNNREMAVAIARKDALNKLLQAGIDLDKGTYKGLPLSDGERAAAGDFVRQAEQGVNKGEDNSFGQYLENSKISAQRAAEDAKIVSDSLYMTRDAAEAYRIQQELLNEAKRTETPLTAKQIQDIKDVGKAYGDTEKLRMAQAATEDWRRSIKGAFTDFVTGARTFSEAIGDIIMRLVEMQASKAFDMLWSGGLGKASGDLFGGLFGGMSGPSLSTGGWDIGHNAMGTDFWRGGPSWVGERGPEIVNLPRGASVTPNHRLGGQTIVNQSFHLHAEGAVMTDELMANLSAQAQATAAHELAKYDKALPAKVQQVSRDPRARS